ncbi:MAG TPA: hypothetical protein VNK96_02985 [Fimbriimonadales bacterium]|nr:hypothetical protein [Fimbriimonadales bacterium]
MSHIEVRRFGVIMEPESGNPLEEGGVLNPACARNKNGELFLFPRLVAKGNYSRIGICKILFDDDGNPMGVERLGIALEPKKEYEKRGCEDPRITYISRLEHYVMTYTALSAHGPRIAIAISEDLFHWEPMGLARFHPFRKINFAEIDNKDGVLFPEPVPGVTGKPSFAMIHRPHFPETQLAKVAQLPRPRVIDLEKESLWISYSICPPEHLDKARQCKGLCQFHEHHRIAAPVEPWERLKIGAGTPPVQCKFGWLVLYHGVCHADTDENRFRYSAGMLVLDAHDPRIILYRSREPVFEPELEEEKDGFVPNVVFPTAIDQRIDLGQPNRYDVYYGMADTRIGALSLTLPDSLPPEAKKDPHLGKV